MKVLKNAVIHEIEINRSRFICYLLPIKSQEEAKQFISLTKKQHHDATHNCSAYIFGDTGEYGGSNDDGEPSGTAGVPMLEVLRKNKVTNIVAVVTRYYGGIKLGAGGLIRAYAKSVSEALKLSNLELLKKYTNIEIQIPYSFLGLIELPLSNVKIIDKKFETFVTITIEVESALVDSFINEITFITSGNATINKI